MNIEKVNINLVKVNQNNPRIIKDERFKQLVKSIKDFPEMLQIRPIVVDENMIVLGGNMRLKACKEAGMSEVYIIKVSELNDEQRKKFIIKDNVSYGVWDFQSLNNEWNISDLYTWDLSDNIDNNNELFDIDLNEDINTDSVSKTYQPIYQPPVQQTPTQIPQPINNETYRPTLEPGFNFKDVSKDDVEKTADKLNNNLYKEKTYIECMCPECGNEFSIEK